MVRAIAVAVLVSLPLAACDPPPPPPGASALAERALRAEAPEGEMLLMVERREADRTLVCGYWRNRPDYQGGPVALEVGDGEASARRIDPEHCKGVLPEPPQFPPVP